MLNPKLPVNIDHDVKKNECVDNQHDDDRKVEPQKLVKFPIEKTCPKRINVTQYVAIFNTKLTFDQTLVCKLHIQGRTFPPNLLPDSVPKEFHIQ